MPTRKEGKAPHSGDAFAGMPDKASATRGPMPSGKVSGRKEEGYGAAYRGELKKEMDDGRRSPARSPKGETAKTLCASDQFKNDVSGNYSRLAKVADDGKTEM